MNETRELAKFVSKLRYDELPQEVVEKTKDLTLDQLGVQLASSALPWSKIAYKYVRAVGGTPESTIVAYGDKTSAVNAAFVNGTFGHGFEMDDTHRKAMTHPGCVVIPTVLAVGEKELIDGRAFLLAAVAGFDVMGRIALAVTPELVHRGPQPTGTTGSFAAAAAAGKIWGLDQEKMLNAVAIAAGAYAIRVDREAQVGVEQKRIYGGAAAANGIRAALLAKYGLTGMPNILEGRFGFCRSFVDKFELEEITRNLGKEYKGVMDVAYKMYASEGYLLPMYEACRNIMQQHPIAPDEVGEVIVGTNRDAVRVSGAIVEPQDISAAHFSGPFGIGLRLVKGGNGFKEYTEENLRDPDVLRIARKVRLVLDEGLDKMHPGNRGADVTIVLKDGKSYHNRIDDLRVLSRQDIQDKFRELATPVVGSEKTERIIEMVMGLDRLKVISVLAALLCL